MIKKYPPKVYGIIESMRRGNELTCELRLSSVTYDGYGRAVKVGASPIRKCGNRTVSAQAWRSIMDTRGDLIECITKGMVSGSFQLTERGKSVNLDKNGQEMPEGWLPPPVKPPRWPGVKVFVCTGNYADGKRRMKVFVTEEAYTAWGGLSGKDDAGPWMQIAGPDLRYKTPKQKREAVKAYVAERTADPAYVVELVESPIATPTEPC